MLGARAGLALIRVKRLGGRRADRAARAPRGARTRADCCFSPGAAMMRGMRMPWNTYALWLTCSICGVLECLAIALFWAREGSFLAGLSYSVVVFGPLSAWMGPSLYRYIRRASGW